MSKGKNGANIRARLFGLLFHENNREISIVNLSFSRSGSRVILDDKTVPRETIFRDISLEFGNDTLMIHHPPGWEDVLQSIKANHSVGSKIYKHSTLIDPNDESIFQDKRSQEILMKVFEDTKKIYKETLRKWTMGTGGGARAPHDFSNREKRDPEYFNGY